MEQDDNSKDDFAEESKKNDSRQSKQISREKSRLILEKLNADKDLIDLSESGSDYEEEMIKEKQKHFSLSSSDDDNFEEM